MHLLIDVYNVLHAWAGLGIEKADPSVTAMARLIGQGRHRDQPAKLICDGTSPAGQPSRTPLYVDSQRRITVIYAGPGRDADSLIEELIERTSGPRDLLVVSTDRRLRKAARRRKAKSQDSASFVLELINDASRAEEQPEGGARTAPDANDVESWMRYFGVQDEAEAQPEGRREPPRSGSAPETGSRDSAWERMGIDVPEIDMAQWVEGIERLPKEDS